MIRSQPHLAHTISRTISKTIECHNSAKMTPIEKALAYLESQKCPNYSKTALLFGVDRSTLSRRHRGVAGSKADKISNGKLLSSQQETTLIEYINRLTDRGTPPTPAMIRNFATDIAGIAPSKMWLSRFVNRHREKLNSGFQLGFDLDRKKADNIYEYTLWFDLVSVLKW